MTPEQIAAIADMQLTQDAIRTLVADGLIVVAARGNQAAVTVIEALHSVAPKATLPPKRHVKQHGAAVATMC